MRLGEVRGRDRALCVFYALFAFGGLVTMGALAVAFVRRNANAGPADVIRNFLHDATTNLASQFIYADLVLIWLGLAAFMIVESRRLGIRYVWAYIVGAPALALCASFAVFMYVRQLKIAALDEERRPAAGAAPREALSGAGH
ncbi:DUF2834 domain-containing protein [Streptomyces rectiverticillatus]|uniref:DUF2834 domain-containing protein n=1 Tax=Streptomyces rectiverticillatus TaxID=173860 RepID=UPI0015C2EDFA|nr:DUF2834 domain-containing protein [Streptomyces rectiverticillatus]QLE74784.1 DUF2834 domain-containing protein [Streptomyces rectiverticillatus]